MSIELPDIAPMIILPGATLFPHSMMPLFIFEPRYREMLAWALERDRMFCVATMRPGVEEVMDAADFYPCAGIGLIRTCVQHEDGTSHLVLQGVDRVRFLGFEKTEPFRVARIAPVRGGVSDLARSEERALIVAVVGALAERFNAEVLRAFAEVEDGDELCDLVAPLLDVDTIDKQRLLMEQDVLVRLGLVVSFLAKNSGCVGSQVAFVWGEMFDHRKKLEAIVRDPSGKVIARALVRRGRYIIGKEQRNEICVDNDTISAKHARLTISSDTEFAIEDLGSANGTRVDGVAAQSEVSFGSTAEIEIGQCRVDIYRAGLPASIFELLPEHFLEPARYRIGEAVVYGRTSTFYRAWDSTVGREVAVKVMRAECQADPGHALRFIREAQICGQLQHPGILPVYDFGLDEESRLYYTTRFVEGEPLSQFLDEVAVNARLNGSAPRPTPTLGSMLRSFLKVCEVIAYAHSRGICHAGLRPEVIEVGSVGEVFVTTWGGARMLPMEVNSEVAVNVVPCIAARKQVKVTPYTAPELISGEEEVASPLCDIFSLGAILLQLISLRPPYSAPDEETLKYYLIHGLVTDGPMASEHLSHWPSKYMPLAVVDLALKCISPNPAERPHSVRALQRELTAWMDAR